MVKTEVVHLKTGKVFPNLII